MKPFERGFPMPCDKVVIGVEWFVWVCKALLVRYIYIYIYIYIYVYVHVIQSNA